MGNRECISVVSDGDRLWELVKLLMKIGDP